MIGFLIQVYIVILPSVIVMFILPRYGQRVAVMNHSW